MPKYIATIEILLEVEDHGEACDAIAEAMRPMLKEFGGECFIDWSHVDAASSPREATQEEIGRFEYAIPAAYGTED